MRLSRCSASSPSWNTFLPVFICHEEGGGLTLKTLKWVDAVSNSWDKKGEFLADVCAKIPFWREFRGSVRPS